MDLAIQLEKQGYAIIRSSGEFHVPDLFQDTKVNPVRSKSFIDEYMIHKVNTLGGTGWDIQYAHFRVSCGSNSSDASIFHRDVFAKGGMKGFNTYTILCYLDPARMEIIKDSHRRQKMSQTEAVVRFFDVQQIILNPGDVMIFNDSLLHRGIFRYKGSRRLIQLFGAAKTPAEIEEQMRHTYFLPAKPTAINDKKGEFAQKVSKISWAIAIPNFVGYMNAATGYGADFSKEHLLFRSEGFSMRAPLVDDFVKDNCYVKVRPDTRDASPELAAYIAYVSFHYPYFLYWSILFILFFMTIYVMWLVYCKIAKLT